MPVDATQRSGQDLPLISGAGHSALMRITITCYPSQKPRRDRLIVSVVPHDKPFYGHDQSVPAGAFNRVYLIKTERIEIEPYVTLSVKKLICSWRSCSARV